MNRKTRLAAAIALACSASIAQATTYNVSATFSDGGVQGVTLFDGSFDWNGSVVSNFQGLLSASMWAWDVTKQTFTTGLNGTGMAMPTQYLDLANNCSGGTCTGYVQNESPWYNLSNQLATSTSGDYVTVTTFKINSTDVVMGGGYDVSSNVMAYGMPDQNARNNNAFFTLVFDKNNPANTSLTFNQMIYGDMTRFGMMGPMVTGWMGMTGIAAGGSMGGMPMTLTVAAVPEPETYAMMMAGLGLVGWMSRRRKAQGQVAAAA
jgi:hypothetical protein